MNKNVIQHLLHLSDNQLDCSMKVYIEKWSDPPAPLQILEVLDYCIHSSLASGFTISVLQALYDLSCKQDNTTHEEVVKLAVWRDGI